jgi:hypothetical protein
VQIVRANLSTTASLRLFLRPQSVRQRYQVEGSAVLGKANTVRSSRQLTIAIGCNYALHLPHIRHYQAKHLVTSLASKHVQFISQELFNAFLHKQIHSIDVPELEIPLENCYLQCRP